MQAQFDYTVDDLVEVMRKGIGNLQGEISWKWSSLLYFSFCSFVIAYFLIKVDRLLRLAISIFIALIVGGCYTLIHRKLVDNRLRKICLKQMNGNSVGKFYIELREEGYFWRQENIENLHTWNKLAKLSLSSDSIDFITQAGDYTLVRRRAFDSDDAYQKFFDYAESLRLKNQVSS